MLEPTGDAILRGEVTTSGFIHSDLKIALEDTVPVGKKQQLFLDYNVALPI